MKPLNLKNPLLVLSLLLILSSGCGLLPKKVEYFQKTVEAVPTASSALQENQKQAAAALDQEITKARLAAAETKADPSVREPLDKAAPVARALSYSIGAPISIWSGDLTNLASTLSSRSAKLDKKIDDYAKDVQPNVGKRIEGTGLIQLGYFTNLGVFLGLGALVWFGLKVYGAFNPAVGLGTAVVGRVSSKLVHAGFHEVVAGGEKFKDLLAHTNKSFTADEVKKLFEEAHDAVQSTDTAALIKRITG